ERIDSPNTPRYASLALALLSAVVLPVCPLLAATWIVAQDGSGDFTEIQPAIDAAQAGDLILVKPGTYASIVVNKAVTIVGSGEDQTIVSDAGSSEGWAVLISDLAGDALIAYLRAKGDKSLISTIAPGGRYIAWRIVTESTEPGAVGVGDVAAAWLNNVAEYHDPSETYAWAESPAGMGAMLCRSVFVSQCHFTMWDRGDYGTFRGGAGIGVGWDARVFIAETNAIGGAGGYGYWGEDCNYSQKGGTGGAGVYLYRDYVYDSAEAYIFGRPENLIRGGKGGRGKDDFVPTCDLVGPGGDGGEGIWVEWSSGVATYAGVTPEGGLPGSGDPPGAWGPPTRGNVTEIPFVATSTMEGDGKPGSTASFSFHGRAGDRLLIAYSTRLDVLELSQTEGHPLMVSPTGTFGLIPAGTIDASGTKTISALIPADMSPGQPFYVQGIVLDGGPPEITNLSMLVTTPVWN
ncbi:MAG: hypothetical protein AB1486_22000, partial [Planctomycetota bacterium]